MLMCSKIISDYDNAGDLPTNLQVIHKDPMIGRLSSGMPGASRKACLEFIGQWWSKVWDENSVQRMIHHMLQPEKHVQSVRETGS